jgi:F0F1-type ATP synthase beta subunit
VPEKYRDSFHSLSTWQSSLQVFLEYLVPIEETIKGFNMIIDGELDKYPEAAFNLKGKIEEVITAGEKMLAEAAANA